MSVEHILKAAAAKNRKKGRKSGNGVAAVDSRYTGEEPIWDGWETWPVEQFWKEYSRLFNFYNYYLTAKDTKPAVLEWMGNNGYTKEDISAVKAAPDYFPGMTTGALCTCLNKGMPTIHPGINEYLKTLREDAAKVEPCDIFVKEAIANAIIEGKKTKQKDTVQTIVAEKPSGISPMDRLRAKCNKTIIMDLELLMDEWCKSGDEVKCLSIYKSMQHYELPAAACTFVEEYLQDVLKEMSDAQTGASEYLAEAYSCYTKKQMLARIDALSSMIDDLMMFKTSTKAAKAPREKKPTAATKQIAKLQYLKHSEEFKITSINPIRIVGAHRLLAFNVKTRVLFDYVTSITGGFIVKGTTIQNYDEVSSRCIRLRKPDEFIPIAVGSTEKQLEKAWGQLTTKESKPNGRINGDIVLLRIL
jgi:hypothetical protein